MLVLWIVVAIVAYFLLLGFVLAFFSAAAKANERWVRTFRKAHLPTSTDRDHIHAA
jgi:hypothetical protein